MSRSPWNFAVAVRWSAGGRERSGRTGGGGHGEVGVLGRDVSLDGDGEAGERNWRSASSMPAADQRRHMAPLDQCLTLREVRRQISIIDSIGFR